MKARASGRWFSTKPRTHAVRLIPVEVRTSASRSSTHPESNRVSITFISFPDGPDEYPNHLDVSMSEEEAEKFARDLLERVAFVRDGK